MTWESVIGLEVHIQLKTQSKIFSGSSTAYGAEPNTQVCGIDIALPGVLPVLNESAVHMALKFGLSINAEIPPYSVFARKNYFYPDLPKGYQISQHDRPIVGPGTLDIILKDGEVKRIRILRAHLEEDAGKSLHEDFRGMTGIDLNRSGIALLEIVSEPDMRSADEAIAYLKTIHTLVRYLDICDGNMQEGSFRCDVNVSVRKQGDPKLGTRTETKNVNSFRFVDRAIQYEIERQIQLLESGRIVKQETRLYDPDKNETRSLRSKEEAQDYRYFPDPDLQPVFISAELIEKARQALPELPHEKRERFMQNYQLGAYDANILIMQPALSDYFEKTVEHANSNPKMCANWIISELLGALKKNNLSIQDSPIKADALGTLIQRIIDETISSKIAKDVFEKMFNTGVDPDTIIEKEGLKQVTDTSFIEKIIDGVISANPEQLAEYRAGKDKLFGFFVGQCMKASEGKVNPAQLNALLMEKLKN